jgi:hypothetical protein
MLPVPWGDREFSQLRVLNGGTPNGGVILLKAETNSRTVVFETRMGAARQEHRIRAEADRETMRPISTEVHSIGIEFGVEYGATAARVRTGAGDTAAVPLNGPVFDEESLMFLLRRLPLAPGYHVTLPILSMQGMLGKSELAVEGVEDIEVPAGNFHCYRLTAGIPKQTYWVGVDGARPLVRFQTGTAGFELLAVSNTELAFPFMNPTLGVLIQPSAGWNFARAISFLTTDMVDLSDAEGRARAYVWMTRMSVAPGQIAEVLRDSVPEKMSQRQELGLENYRLRMGSTVSRLIGGHQAISCIAEYTANGKAMAEYFTWILSEKAKVLLSVTAEVADLPSVQQRFDAIIETTRLM